MKSPSRSATVRLASALSRALPMSRADLVLHFRPDEVYRAATDDGAAIALGRYHPRGERRFDEPVIVCHGIGANRFHLDFDERHSLARHLARAGFETWVLELRGRGLSGPPVDATFDDEAEHDVAAALRVVRSTGADQVHWVGHSKGGLLAWAHLARRPDAPIASVVALGSPVVFGVQPALKALVTAATPMLRMKRVPVSQAQPLALLGLSSAIGRFVLNSGDIAPGIAARLVANVAADIPGGVVRQFARWISEGVWNGEDGFDYARGLAHVRAPALVIAGGRDSIAPPAAVTPVEALLGGPKEVLVASPAAGFSVDYGHGDLALGRRAPEEIFPRVARFLASHSSAPYRPADR